MSSIEMTAAAEWRRFWFLPFTAALGYSTSVIHINSIGPFIASLQQEFGWTRAQVSSGLTVAALITAIFCIPVGMLVDKIGPRRVGLLGVLAVSAAFALLGTATGSTTNWMLLWSVVAVAMFWVQATVWTSAVASRFEHARGVAFAITLSGASFSASVIPILVTWLIGNYGWRRAFMVVGALWATVVFPLLLCCFRSAQDATHTHNIKASRAPTGLTLAEGLRSAALYKLVMAGGLFAFTVVGIGVHFIPILTDTGTSRLAAASIASLIGLFSIVGRLSTGLVLDRFPAHLVGMVAFLIPIVACALLLFDGANHSSQTLAAAIFGLTVGSEVDVIAYLAAKQFGLKNFGALYGALVMALALGTAFGPLVAGMVFDRYGNYAPFLLLGIALMAVSAVALFTLGAKSSRAEPVF